MDFGLGSATYYLGKEPYPLNLSFLCCGMRWLEMVWCPSGCDLWNPCLLSSYLKKFGKGLGKSRGNVSPLGNTHEGTHLHVTVSESPIKHIYLTFLKPVFPKLVWPWPLPLFPLLITTENVCCWHNTIWQMRN